MSKHYKAQFKRTSQSQWETSASSGNEPEMYRELERNRSKHAHARIIDEKGALVA